jgi:superfamily II DNA or RNA helicase
MLQLQAVQGLNNKQFIHVKVENKDDLPTLKLIEAIVTRTEYKPFIRSINKNVKQTYFIDQTYIPAVFWADIKKNLQPAVPYKLEIKDDWMFYNNDLKRDEFNEYMETVILPEKYDIWDENYFYQLESVYRAILFKIARIEVGTSGGKTLITYLYCRYMIDKIIPKGKKVLIIVPRQLLAKQLAADFAEYDAMSETPVRVETIYSNSKRIADANIVVGVYNSLADYESDYFDDFYTVICDEVHGAKAYSIRNGIYAKCFHTHYFFGMTGSYPDYNSLDYLNIVSMFGPLVLVKKTWELIRDGNATPVQINRVLINYPPEEIDFSRNLKASGFTGVDKYRIEKAFFQKHIPRNTIMCKLINGHELNHLVLVESVEYCKFLRDFIQEHCPERYVDIIYGAVKDRDEIINIMRNRNDMVLIATYETMSTGVSVPSIANIHFPDGGRSEIRVKQSVGRSLRIYVAKLLANVWDYVDNMPGSSFKNHAVARHKIYVKEKLPIVEYTVNLKWNE